MATSFPFPRFAFHDAVPPALYFSIAQTHHEVCLRRTRVADEVHTGHPDGQEAQFDGHGVWMVSGSAGG